MYMETPLGRSFEILIFAIWVLPFAAPLLIGAVANNLVIKVLLVAYVCGCCQACKRQFVGYKNRVIRCGSCGNSVAARFSRDGRGGPSSSKSEPEIIDVDVDEK
ncbi:uncharacterized protein [Pyrus communis]|uniref:uncharacterized protein n=1 Tax=Pyrus communis TaxID=23211 RepID=UPI0035C0CB86